MSSEQLSQRIERDVRQLIGDLHMQLIVMRAMVDLSQHPQPQHPEPAPPPKPHQPEPIPPQPEQEPVLPKVAKTNGTAHQRG